MTTNIIVNADDLGIAECVNNGIVTAMQTGIITSASLMACGRAFAHAVELIRQHQIASVGVHLVLDEETPLLPPSEIPSIVGRDGRFFCRSKLLKHLLPFRRIDPAHVEKEFRAQICRCLEAGVPVTHLDGHGHVHVYPGIVDVVIALARETGIRHVRMPHERMGRLDLRPFRLGKSINKLIVTTFALLAKGRYRSAGLHFPDGFAGMRSGGHLTTEVLDEMMRHLPDSSEVEIMTHPGQQDEQLEQDYASWNYHWAEELAAVTRWNRSEFESRHGVHLIHR